ncbi:MAG: hypothetical protein QXE31_02390 [Candidatus Woesearchaeota archaeon]
MIFEEKSIPEFKINEENGLTTIVLQYSQIKEINSNENSNKNDAKIFSYDIVRISYDPERLVMGVSIDVERKSFFYMPNESKIPIMPKSSFIFDSSYRLKVSGECAENIESSLKNSKSHLEEIVKRLQEMTNQEGIGKVYDNISIQNRTKINRLIDYLKNALN